MRYFLTEYITIPHPTIPGAQIHGPRGFFAMDGSEPRWKVVPDGAQAGGIVIEADVTQAFAERAELDERAVHLGDDVSALDKRSRLNGRVPDSTYRQGDSGRQYAIRVAGALKQAEDSRTK